MADNFWLGRSLSGSDKDAAATYDEVRIWDRPLTEAQLSELARLGPNSWRFGGTFKKRGAGTLTLTGANTFAVPTEVEGGTLALAAGASLASDVLVKTGGVFAVAATATPPPVAIEVGENGTCGCVTPTSGVLDLGRLSLGLANPEALANGRTYVICRSPGGFSGTLSMRNLPHGWQPVVFPSQGEIRLSKSGLAIIIR